MIKTRICKRFIVYTRLPINRCLRVLFIFYELISIVHRNCDFFKKNNCGEIFLKSSFYTKYSIRFVFVLNLQLWTKNEHVMH